MMFGPIYALINLFICILRDVRHSRVDAALSLMDVGTGFFARLKLASNSTICIQFAKEMASLAHAVVDRATNSHVDVNYLRERLSRPDQSPALQGSVLAQSVEESQLRPSGHSNQVSTAPTISCRD
jgi:hypothetical protein